MGEAKERGVDKGMMRAIVQASGDAARATVNSPEFMGALARQLIREAATNPGGYNSRPIALLSDADFLATPHRLADNTTLVLTLFPIESPMCYTLIAAAVADPHAADHDHDEHGNDIPKAAPVPVRKGPVEVGAEEPQLDAANLQVGDYSMIVYRDHPGNAAKNVLVQLLQDEATEINRQLRTMGFTETRWLYVTKLEVKDAKAQ